jgi:3-hydroxyacyl-CoA dehydrogenase
MKPRDAVLTFQCFSPDLVQVIEMIDGRKTHHQEVKRHPDVVTEMEKKYMFFGEQADIARKQIMRNQSCVFNVYFREP